MILRSLIDIWWIISLVLFVSTTFVLSLVQHKIFCFANQRRIYIYQVAVSFLSMSTVDLSYFKPPKWCVEIIPRIADWREWAKLIQNVAKAWSWAGNWWKGGIREGLGAGAVVDVTRAQAPIDYELDRTCDRPGGDVRNVLVAPESGEIVRFPIGYAASSYLHEQQSAYSGELLA